MASYFSKVRRCGGLCKFISLTILVDILSPYDFVILPIGLPRLVLAGPGQSPLEVLEVAK